MRSSVAPKLFTVVLIVAAVWAAGSLVPTHAQKSSSAAAKERKPGLSGEHR